MHRFPLLFSHPVAESMVPLVCIAPLKAQLASLAHEHGGTRGVTCASGEVGSNLPSGLGGNDLVSAV